MAWEVTRHPEPSISVVTPSSLEPYHRAIRDIAWLSVASVAVKPFWLFFITVLCARVLGAESYGVLNTALSLAALGFALSNLGISQYTVREVAGDRSLASRFLTNFVALRLTVAVPTAVVAFGIGVALGYERSLLLALGFACLYYAAQSLSEYCHSLFQSFERLRYQALSVVVEKVLVIAGGGVLLYATTSPSLTLLGMAVGMAATAALTVWWTMRYIAPFRRDEFDLGFVGTSVRALVPFALAGVFGMMYFRVDTVIVEAMLGTTAAGQYGLAFRIVEALNMLPLLLVHASLYPRFSSLFKQGEYGELSRLVWIGGAVLLTLSLLVTVGIAAVSIPLIEWIATDPELGPAGTTLQLLCWVFPLTCFRVLIYAALLALHEQRFIAAVLGGGVLLNIALNIILLPILGIYGAAVATICSEFALMATYAFRYSFRLRSLRS